MPIRISRQKAGQATKIISAWAREMAARRWAMSTAEQRLAQAMKMVAGRRKARKHRLAKLAAQDSLEHVGMGKKAKGEK